MAFIFHVSFLNLSYVLAVPWLAQCENANAWKFSASECYYSHLYGTLSPGSRYKHIFIFVQLYILPSVRHMVWLAWGKLHSCPKLTIIITCSFIWLACSFYFKKWNYLNWCKWLGNCWFPIGKTVILYSSICLNCSVVLSFFMHTSVFACLWCEGIISLCCYYQIRKRGGPHCSQPMHMHFNGHAPACWHTDCRSLELYMFLFFLSGYSSES